MNLASMLVLSGLIKGLNSFSMFSVLIALEMSSLGVILAFVFLSLENSSGSLMLLLSVIVFFVVDGTAGLTILMSSMTKSLNDKVFSLSSLSV